MDMESLARVGARVRLAEIDVERMGLQAFIDGRQFDAAPSSTPAATEETVVARKRRGQWSPAQRKAISKRMKAYWAKRTATK